MKDKAFAAWHTTPMKFITEKDIDEKAHEVVDKMRIGEEEHRVIRVDREDRFNTMICDAEITLHFNDKEFKDAQIYAWNPKERSWEEKCLTRTDLETYLKFYGELLSTVLEAEKYIEKNG